jgi:hypothetical protein
MVAAVPLAVAVIAYFGFIRGPGELSVDDGNRISAAYDRVIRTCANKTTVSPERVKRAASAAEVVIDQYRKTPDAKTPSGESDLEPMSTFVERIASPVVSWSRDCDSLRTMAANAIDAEND